MKKISKKSGTVKSGKVGEIDIKILKILKENPEGLRAITIMKVLNLSRRTLYNHLFKLKRLNLVSNIFPIWTLCHIESHPLKVAQLLHSNKIQAHKFSFVLRLISKPYWWEKRNNHLIKLKEFHFKQRVDWGNNPYEQLIKDDFLIHTFSNCIIFHIKKHYWSENPYKAFLEALEDTLELLRFIEERFRFKFFKNDTPQLTVMSHHYVKLNDALAKKCKKEKNLFRIIINNKLRAWIDLSEPFGTEFGHKNYAVEDTRWYVRFIEDGLKNNPPMPSETANNINELTDLTKALSESQLNIGMVLKQIDGNIKHIIKVFGDKSEK